MENFQLELPRDTLIEVEIVQELRGEVSTDKKNFRKNVHIEKVVFVILIFIFGLIKSNIMS